MACNCSSAEEHYSSSSACQRQRRQDEADLKMFGGIYENGIRYDKPKAEREREARMRVIGCGCSSAEDHYIFKMCGSRT